MKLSTIQSEREITPLELKTYSSDLVCILPYNSNKHYSRLKNIYKDIFVSYSNNNEQMSLKTIKNKVFMNKILYLEKNDFEYYKFLIGIRDGKTINEIKLEDENNYLHLEIDDLENNYEIEKMCNLEINKTEGLLPKALVEDSKEELKKAE